MAYYLSSLPDQSKFKLDVNDFFDELMASSEGISIDQKNFEGKPAYEFTVELRTQHPLEGELYDLGQEEGQILRFDGQSDDIVAFIMWFRRYLPGDCRLALYTSSNLDNFIEITSVTTAEAIESF